MVGSTTPHSADPQTAIRMKQDRRSEQETITNSPMSKDRVVDVIYNCFRPIFEDLSHELIRSAQKRAAKIIAEAKQRAADIEDRARQQAK